MWLVIGLKNPGEKYENTRHNIGGLTVKHIADTNFLTLKNNKKLSADLSDPIELNSSSISTDENSELDTKVIFSTPTEFMNNSGIAAKKLLDFYKIQPNKLIVIHDDIELDFGQVKVKTTGSEAGHNGLRSITKYINTRDYYRIRCGISRPENENFPIDKYVLSNFSKSEQKDLTNIYVDVYEKILEIIAGKN